MAEALEHAGGGVEPVEATTVSADPESAVAIFFDSEDSVMGETRGVTRVVPMMNEAALGHRAVECVEAPLLRSDPQRAVAVFVDVQDDVVRERTAARRVVSEAIEGFFAAVEAVETSGGTDPEPPVGIFEDSTYGVATEARRVGRRVPKRGKALRIGVKAIETTRPSSHPERTVAVLVERPNPAVRERTGVVEIVLVNGEGIPVVAVETVLRPYPDEAVPVLENAIDRTLGKTLIDGESPEAYVALLGA